MSQAAYIKITAKWQRKVWNAKQNAAKSCRGGIKASEEIKNWNVQHVGVLLMYEHRYIHSHSHLQLFVDIVAWIRRRAMRASKQSNEHRTKKKKKEINYSAGRKNEEAENGKLFPLMFTGWLPYEKPCFLLLVTKEF